MGSDHVRKEITKFQVQIFFPIQVIFCNVLHISSQREEIHILYVDNDNARLVDSALNRSCSLHVEYYCVKHCTIGGHGHCLNEFAYFYLMKEVICVRNTAGKKNTGIAWMTHVIYRHMNN